MWESLSQNQTTKEMHYKPDAATEQNSSKYLNCLANIYLINNNRQCWMADMLNFNPWKNKG